MAFTWDGNSARYRDARGRYVSRATVTRAVNQVIAKAEIRISEAAEQYRQGNISLDDFQIIMRLETKDTFINASAVGKGGYSQMTQADFGRVGRQLRTQYAYLDRFVAELDAKEIPLDGRFMNRAKMYARSAREEYWKFDEQAHRETGYQEERNILGIAEHCNECRDETDLGWVPIGTLIPIGQRTCLSNCKCAIEYR